MKGTGTQSADEEPISRRCFFEVIGSGAIAVAVIGTGAFTWEYLSPNVLFEPPTAFRAGRPLDYTPGSVTELAEQKSYIVRQGDGTFYAMSVICTHLGCITAWKQDRGVVACPCHGSVFSIHGDVLAGPAPRPLPHFLMALDDRGQLVVDRGVIVPEDRVLKV